MEIRKLFVPAIAAAMMVGSVSTVSAADAIILKASDVHPMDYPTIVAVVNLGKKFEDATKGKYKLQMFPLMQLGGEKEALEQVQLGALAFTRVSVGPVGPIVDDVNVFNLPFVFRDQNHMRKVIDGDIGAELLQKITDNPKANLIGLCWMDSGTRSIFNSKRAINTPADLKGMKIRMMGNPIYVETMNALGGNGVPMGMDEVYNGIATGVVDGAENNEPTYVTHNLNTVAPYYSYTEHLIVPEILVFSKKIWSTLSADEQALLKKFAREAQMDERKLWDVKVQASIDKMKSAGAKVNKIADKAPFQAAVKPVWDKYGAKYAALLQRINAVK
jgi:tripartite ATP-independent transporter DctP family solute receptor